MAPPDNAAPGRGRATTGLRKALPRVDAPAAARRNALLSALNGRGCALGVLRAAIETEPAAGPALRFLCGVAVQPLVVDGTRARWLDAAASPELPEALVELSRLEPMLAAAEAALGVTLDPDHMSSRVERGALGVRLSIRAPDGAEAQALRLCVPAGVALHPRPAPLDSGPLGTGRSGLAARAPVRLRLGVQGPAAPASELGTLSPGDLVLAGGGGLRAWLAAEGGPRYGGRWEPADGRFHFERLMDDDDDDASISAAGPGAPALSVAVRLRLELGEIEVTLGEIAGLAPGAVLKAELAGDSPRVMVTGGGARLAAGRLVSLGEAYGVLVDEVFEAAAATVPGAAAGEPGPADA